MGKGRGHGCVSLVRSVRREAKDVIDDCACQFSTRRCDDLSSAVREGGNDHLCPRYLIGEPGPVSAMDAEVRPGLCAEKPT